MESAAATSLVASIDYIIHIVLWHWHVDGGCLIWMRRLDSSPHPSLYEIAACCVLFLLDIYDGRCIQIIRSSYPSLASDKIGDILGFRQRGVGILKVR